MIPKLRLREFYNAAGYTVYDFSDLFEFSSGKNIKQNEASKEFKTPCVRYGELYHMYSEVIDDVINRTNLESVELRFSLGDEILLPSAGEDPLGIGSASALTLPNIAIGRTINVLRPKQENTYSHIYVAYYINEKLKKKIASLAKGVSISNVYNSDLRTLQAVLPSVAEQNKVASFMRKIDTKINLLTKKKEALETYKKGLMQKIFSQELNFKLEDGTDYPEWETLRIEDISEERSVRGFEEYPLLSITLNNGIVPQELGGKSDSSSSDKSNYKLVRVGDIGYNSMRMWQGASGVSSYEGIVSPAYTVFSLKERANAQYIGYLFKTHRLIGTFKSHSQGLTSDTWNLKYPTLKRIKIKLPSLDEQLRVVKILSQIELNLERLTKRINATEQLKKGLLKHMFV